MAAETIRFGDRLREVLARRGEQATQAWLADRSGIDRSLISRVLGNDRVPTLDTLQALAPALELEIGDLVAGTDAACRLEDGADHVRRSDYEEAIGKVIEYEAKIRDLEAQARSLTETLGREQVALHAAERRRAEFEADSNRSVAKLAESEARSAALRDDLVRYKVALQRALSQFSALKARIDELQKELQETKQSSKTSAILSGVAALASVATVAHFLGGEDAPNGTSSRAKKNGGKT